GNTTLGTAQTGRPSASSAKTAARLPTVPRTTWLDMTMTARPPGSAVMFSATRRHEVEQPPQDIGQQRHPQPSSDARAPELDPIVPFGIAPAHMADNAIRHATHHRRLALQPYAADDTLRFRLPVFVVVPAHFALFRSRRD